MEQERVIAVDGPGGPGSGYVIAPRLVLASAHVLPEPGEKVAVFRPGRADVWQATVVWRGTPAGRDDAALLHIDDPDWIPMPARPVRWGRLATARAGTPCETWGRPDLVQQPGRPVDTAHRTGTLNPGDRIVGNRYVMHLAQHPPQPEQEDASPWGGLSGAALFCGDLLTGVIATDPARHAHAALEAVPAYVLLHDPAFRTALAEHDGAAGSELEPVEWQDLAEAADPVDGLVRSPAALLRARRQTVPFHGRTAQLDQLQAWSDLPVFGALLLYGSGGQGKTRLAQQFANTLTAQRWSVLWLRPDASPESLTMLSAAAVPLLVIVDYAETRTAQVTALLEAAARHSGSTPCKMLLIARTAGDWWQQLQSHTSLAEDLLDNAPTISLSPLEPEASESPTDAYHQALRAYAAQLPRVDGLRQYDWPAIAAHLNVRTPHPGRAATSDSQNVQTALTVHMTALADLLDATPRPLTRTPDQSASHGNDRTVEDRLLKHEERYWAATSSHLHATLTQTTLTDALAAVFLTGADTLTEADDLLACLPALTDQSRDRRNAVRDWIAALYPPTTPGRPWDSLQPDRLAERFIGRRLQHHPELAHHLIPGRSERQAVQILTVYSRAAAQPAFHHQLAPHLTSLCVRHADTLTMPAIEVVPQTEAPGPLLNALQEITDLPGVSLDTLAMWAARLPDASHNLAPWAAHLTQRITDLRRERATEEPTWLLDLASSLNNLSSRLSDLGRREEALEASTEAVAIRRELAAARSDAFQLNLAASLNNLSNRLSDLGRREEALEAITEAVDVYRQLTAARPDAFQPDLATSLNNLSIRLSDLGRREEALEAITEAVDVYRQLTAARPGAFQPDLAASLNNLSIRLSELGRREEALEASTEAVAIRRELAAARPDAFQPNLASSLNNLSKALSELGRREEALEAITKAVDVYRQLTAARPDAFQPNLAMSLNNLSNALSELGRPEEALEAITEAVAIRRELAAAHPDAFQPNLAMSLNNLSNRLGDLGRPEEALEAITEAVAIRRELAAAHPDAFQPN
ncbi:tetratricopeptide repeat protein, partial [Streptomyces sp. NPDC057280]|uniref:tetratricopeptide repeat protein n=1 Tax=Streptomyces sp. NPDC057280 TaxID=3346081 RepID=UPI003642158B